MCLPSASVLSVVTEAHSKGIIEVYEHYIKPVCGYCMDKILLRTFT